MADIFLSYAREDRATAQTVAAAFQRLGWSVWWDERIAVGRIFSQVIEDELDSAKCVVVLWSTQSVKSDWVLSEAAEGARRKILVPARIDDVTPPLEFRRIQTATIVRGETVPSSAGLESCVEAITALVGMPTPSIAGRALSEQSPIAPSVPVAATRPSRLDDADSGLKPGTHAPQRLNRRLAIVFILLGLAAILAVSLFSGDGDRYHSKNDTSGLSRALPAATATTTSAVVTPSVTGHQDVDVQAAPSKRNQGQPTTKTDKAKAAGMSGSGSPPAQTDLANLEPVYRRRTGYGNFTIQVQILCSEETVKRILDTWPDAWFAPQIIKARRCYRIFWGQFATREEAVAALANVPSPLKDPNAAVKQIPRSD